MNHLYSARMQPHPEEVRLPSSQEQQSIGSRGSKPYMERRLTRQLNCFQMHKPISVERSCKAICTRISLFLYRTPIDAHVL